MDTSKIRAKRMGEGMYELRLGDKYVLAHRQPDLFFKIKLDDKEHKGYLKDLKVVFLQWCTGGSSSGSTPAAGKAPAKAQEGPVDYSPGQPAPALPERQEAPGAPWEAALARSLDSKRGRIITYSQEGSVVGLNELDEPLPTVPPKGDLVGETTRWEVRSQIQSKRFPYADGYAVIEKETRLQHAWCKDRSRALTMMEGR